MAGLVFDLADLYKQTFGTNAKILFKDNTTQSGSDNKLKFESKPAESNQYSKLGTPFYEKVEGDALGREFFLPVTLGGLKLPYCVVRITCKKTIVETALVNRKGTVKELINTEDYNIKLRGFVIGENNELPDQAITDLKDLFEKDESVVLRNALTDIFLTGDDKVVIKSIDFPEVKGVKNVRPFEMDIVSDSEFTLIVE